MAEEGFKRKLAATLSADVEGYSRLMDDDEEATVRIILGVGPFDSFFNDCFPQQLVYRSGTFFLSPQNGSERRKALHDSMLK